MFLTSITIVCVLFASVFGNFGEGLVGGFHEVCPLTESHISLLHPFLLKEFRGSSDNTEHMEILSVSTQVVAGTNYRVVVKLGDGTCRSVKIFQSLPIAGDPKSRKMSVTEVETVACPTGSAHCSAGR
ncbi:hypothetical protein EG68_06111 [Paragonimus skrjabini miyazakii]|uniref:Cystatin domain-containing protein n=1 Tax=Paragonimus skrjabini miyazakii TaxID=59628 RepID=A0A8S9YF67_9TREM|nr:hypothetical protein EG68_06111 [Paragonimus skrjabini miyazakii]